MSEMSLKNVLSLQTIDTEIHDFKNKDELFRHIAKLFYKAGFITDEEGYIQALYQREAEGSTYMGNGLVIPHGHSNAVKKAGVAVCRFYPMNYEGETEELSDYAVALAIPASVSSAEYMKLLSKIACSLLDEKVTCAVRTEKDPSVIVDVLLNEIKKGE